VPVFTAALDLAYRVLISIQKVERLVISQKNNNYPDLVAIGTRLALYIDTF